jgi:hypothetical protein
MNSSPVHRHVYIVVEMAEREDIHMAEREQESTKQLPWWKRV